MTRNKQFRLREIDWIEVDGYNRNRLMVRLFLTCGHSVRVYANGQEEGNRARCYKCANEAPQTDADAGDGEQNGGE